MSVSGRAHIPLARTNSTWQKPAFIGRKKSNPSGVFVKFTEDTPFCDSTGAQQKPSEQWLGYEYEGFGANVESMEYLSPYAL